MKRSLALILAFTLCLILCACERPEDDSSNADNSVIIYRHNDTCINGKKIWDITTRIELTTENWREYLVVYPHERSYKTYDAFGEIVSTETQLHYYLGADVTKYHCFSENAVIELKDKQTGELRTCDLYTNWAYYGPDDSTDALIVKNLDNYECTRIQGYLYFIDIPDEAIIASDYEDVLDSFKIYYKGRSTQNHIDSYTKHLSRPLDEMLYTLGIEEPSK